MMSMQKVGALVDVDVVDVDVVDADMRTQLHAQPLTQAQPDLQTQMHSGADRPTSPTGTCRDLTHGKDHAQVSALRSQVATQGALLESSREHLREVGVFHVRTSRGGVGGLRVCQGWREQC